MFSYDYYFNIHRFFPPFILQNYFSKYNIIYYFFTFLQFFEMSTKSSTASRIRNFVSKLTPSILKDCPYGFALHMMCLLSFEGSKEKLGLPHPICAKTAALPRYHPE